MNKVIIFGYDSEQDKRSQKNGAKVAEVTTAEWLQFLIAFKQPGAILGFENEAGQALSQEEALDYLK